MTQRSNHFQTRDTAPMRAAQAVVPQSLLTRVIAVQALILVVVVLITTPSGAG